MAEEHAWLFRWRCMKKVVLISLPIIIVILVTVQLKKGFLSLLILAASVLRPTEKAFMGKLIDDQIVKRETIPGRDRGIPTYLYMTKGKDVFPRSPGP
jgi:hypothetical protein